MAKPVESPTLKEHAPMFDDYRDKYENVTMKRENGILEIALHTRGGPLVFNGYVHEALVRAFRDIGDDRDNHVVILTGTGDEFCAQLSPELKKQSPLTLRYTRMALSTRFRRRLQEGLSYGLALEGISAAQVAALHAQKAKG